jgi:hypothetical protein
MLEIGLMKRRWAYLRVVHVRARGAPTSRLRNIGLLIALKAGVKYFSFIESDMIADPLLLKRRLLAVMRNILVEVPVFSVSYGVGMWVLIILIGLKGLEDKMA